MSEPSTSRVVVVDDDRALRQLLGHILTSEGYDVVGTSTAEEALTKITRQPPDLAIIDVMLPGMDGFSLCRKLRQNTATRYLPILMLTARDDIADKIAGFEAGADDYLTKPFQPKELSYRVKSLLARSQVPTPIKSEGSKRGRVIAFFGSKGGVGKTTIAVNMAVALRQRTGRSVALFDADFFFGDVGVHMNLPTVRSILDLIEQIDRLDMSVAEQALLPHVSGVRVLLSPFRPEEGERITAGHVTRLLDFLATLYDYVVIDCPPSYDDRVLMILENADDIMLIVTPEVGPLKNSSLFLDLAGKLGVPLEKIHIVLNRSNSNVGIGPEEIERTLKHHVAYRIISGGRPVVLSVNRGVPIVMEQPDHPLSMQISTMAEQLLQTQPGARGNTPPTPRLSIG